MIDVCALRIKKEWWSGGGGLWSGGLGFGSESTTERLFVIIATSLES